MACNVDKFIASVKVLHLTYENLRQPYQNWCGDCLQLNQQLSNRETSTWKSCMVHAGQPRLMPLGNMTASPIVRSEAQRAKNTLDEKHIRKGSVQVLPGHIYNLHYTNGQNPNVRLGSRDFLANGVGYDTYWI